MSINVAESRELAQLTNMPVFVADVARVNALRQQSEEHSQISQFSPEVRAWVLTARREMQMSAEERNTELDKHLEASRGE
jgi:hypothetical protein